MNENLRFIVSELKKSPWKKNFSIISFDSLSSEQVLQVLTDVLAEIDPRNKVDIQEENPEKMAVRMLGMLRAIKYRPPDIIAENFRRKLVEGDKAVVCSILQWILEKPITELKRRAYLAKYLVKVEIPPEVIYDAEVATLSQQYERLIDEFVAVHREWEGVMGGEGVAGAVGERRSDLAAMQRETQQVALWLQRMKAKVDGVAGAEALLQATRLLRLERVRAGELRAQREEQAAGAARAEEAVARLRRELALARSEAKHASASGLVRRVEEALRLSSYLASEKLPAEVGRAEAEVHTMRLVAAAHPAPSTTDLDTLRATLADLTREIAAMARPPALRSEEGEELLAPLRQQCALAATSKVEAEERLMEARTLLREIEDEGSQRVGLQQQRYGNAAQGGHRMVHAMQAELGVVVRTLEVLQQLHFASEDQRSADVKIAASASDVIPSLQKELRESREQYQDVKSAHDKKRRLHEMATAGIEAQVTKVEQELHAAWDECLRVRQEQANAEARLHVIAVQHQRLSQESQLPHSTFRERLSEQASAEAHESRLLAEEQRRVQGLGAETALRRVALWTHVRGLLEVKRKDLEAPAHVQDTIHRGKGSETLVLP
ncbi:intraflagellar transport protein 81 homolog [Ischnura elegans]|uniref:intraflagellar transport protein 81 homolog n=1 Tax=Ischnura elegans TaxID=197161 RepID=UPI001ED87A66|nr:intraflagellar transport protein 81 homolog [Ischnura elegans]